MKHEETKIPFEIQSKKFFPQEEGTPLPVLQVEDLSLSYQTREGEVAAIADVSFHVNPGEYISIVGPSGCGKSTLLSLLAGLMPADGGRITFPTEASIGYMLQKDHLFEWRTILDNVTLGLEIMGCKTAENTAYARELLHTYGLGDFIHARPSQLSGGMRQRCALIRTLATRPEILLLDEPFSALDYQTRLAVSDDIYSIIRREKKTAVMVTHDISESVSMSDRVIVLSGRPARVKRIFSLEFARETATPLVRRNAPEFRAYFNAVWKELDLHVQ